MGDEESAAEAVCVGESMAVLSADSPGPLETVGTFRSSVGGAESNTACGLAARPAPPAAPRPPQRRRPHRPTDHGRPPSPAAVTALLDATPEQWAATRVTAEGIHSPVLGMEGAHA